MKIPPRYTTMLRRLDESSCIDWIATLFEIGEDPQVFFENSDWRHLDFSMSDMRGISFRGAILDGAKFRKGHLTRNQRAHARSARDIVEVGGEADAFSMPRETSIRFRPRVEIRRALDHLNGGKSVLLLGQAGSGKSFSFKILTGSSPQVRVIGREIGMGGRRTLASLLFEDARMHGWPGINPLVLDRYERQIDRRIEPADRLGKGDRSFVNTMMRAFAITNPGGCALGLDDLIWLPSADLTLLIRAARRYRIRLILDTDLMKFNLSDNAELAFGIRRGDFGLVDLSPPTSGAIAEVFMALKFPPEMCGELGKELAGLGYDPILKMAPWMRTRGLAYSVERLITETIKEIPFIGPKKPQLLESDGASVLDLLDDEFRGARFDDVSDDALPGAQMTSAILDHLELRGIVRRHSKSRRYSFSIERLNETWRQVRKPLRKRIKNRGDLFQSLPPDIDRNGVARGVKARGLRDSSVSAEDEKRGLEHPAHASRTRAKLR